MHIAHPPLEGKFRSVTPEAWDTLSVPERLRPEKQFLTRAAAAYTGELNKDLATQLVTAVVERLRPQPMVRVGYFNNTLVKQEAVIPRSTVQVMGNMLSIGDTTGANNVPKLGPGNVPTKPLVDACVGTGIAKDIYQEADNMLSTGNATSANNVLILHSC